MAQAAPRTYGNVMHVPFRRHPKFVKEHGVWGYNPMRSGGLSAGFDEEHNQDYAAITHCGAYGKGAVLAIANGSTEHPFGVTAAEIAVKTIMTPSSVDARGMAADGHYRLQDGCPAAMLKNAVDEGRMEETLREAFGKAHENVRLALGGRQGIRSGVMRAVLRPDSSNRAGTSLTVAAVNTRGKLIITHAGHSSAYVVHDGIARRITSHTGMREPLDTPLGRGSRPTPQVYKMDLKDKDIVLLTTPGIMLDGREIGKILKANSSNMHEACAQLIVTAHAVRGESRGEVSAMRGSDGSLEGIQRRIVFNNPLPNATVVAFRYRAAK